MFKVLFTVATLVMILPHSMGHSPVVGGSEVPEPELWAADVPELLAKLERWPSADSVIMPSVAWAVAKHSHLAGVPSDLTLAVMRVENPWLKPDTVSHAGAVGLLQIMPRFWADEFPHCGYDLTDVEVNVCKGIAILRHYIDRHETLEGALLAYNGCRSSYCRHYSENVQRQLD